MKYPDDKAQQSGNKYPGTKIMKCTCYSPMQDQMYGAGNRVHNRVDGKGKQPAGYACTVCTPRNLSCDKLASVVPPNPAFGIKELIPARKPRNLKPISAK